MTQKDLPVKIQVLYGLGVSYAIVDQIFVQWVMYYYLPPTNSGLKTLIAPIFLSLAFLISRLVDAFADPLIGYWSDRTSTRWGRRIPFIAFGAIPLVLMSIAFFYPLKSEDGVQTFMYLSLVGSMFFIFYTIVGAPYNALIPEISSSNRDRLNLSTWQSVFRLAFTAIAMILPGVLIKVLGGGDTEKGLRYMVILLGCLALVGMFITVFSIDEKKYSGGKTSDAKFWESLGLVLSHKAFLLYLAGFLMFFFGFNILRATMNYYVEDIMNMGKVEITLASGLLFGMSALFFYPVNRFSKKFGYRIPMLISLFVLTILSICMFYLGKVFPSSMGFVLFALMGIPIAGAAFIFPPAMLSEISAVATQKSDVQIEGLFFGIQGFVLKFAFFLSGGILPIVLVSGTSMSFVDSLVTKPTGVSTSGVYLTSLIAAGAFAVSFFFYYLYPEEIAEDA